MSALDFVQSLADTGRVIVLPALDPPGDLEPAVRMLDDLARADLAFEAPPLVLAAGQWALTLLYRGCQALVYREIAGDAVRDGLSQPCPEKVSPAVHYSVDLSFRFLPDLLKLSCGVAREDPLVEGLLALARQWPLSSVGVEAIGPVEIDSFFAEPCLRSLYIDRIIAREDQSRLDHAGVRQAIREALGAYDRLSPKLAGHLKEGDVS